MKQISMRRTMSSMIERTDAKTGEPRSVRVGEKVPPYTVETIEVAHKSTRNIKRFKRYQGQLGQQLSAPEITAGPHPKSGFIDKRDTAARRTHFGIGNIIVGNWNGDDKEGWMEMNL